MALDFASAELSEEEFRDRRERARRGGDPAWLWPEVSVGHLADVQLPAGSSQQLCRARIRVPSEHEKVRSKRTLVPRDTSDQKVTLPPRVSAVLRCRRKPK